MTLTQVWGALLILLLCPLLGGLPLIAWMTNGLTGRHLTQVGTGNVSVSAAFYHGGTAVGVLAVISEAFKGIAAVFLARYFFPVQPEWELIALIMLVLGRYWMGKGAGTTNVVWGFVVHEWKVALLVFLIGGISFTIFRDRATGRLGVLILFPLILALLHPNNSARIVAGIGLGVLLAWIYQNIPDDLDLPPNAVKGDSQSVFRFFQGDKAIISLDRKLDPHKVGQKAATLSQLKRWGYPVPTGWVLPPGDDSEPLVNYLPVSEAEPLVVRSSAIGEDSTLSSAAGQYQSILNVTNRTLLQAAMTQVLASYNDPLATDYRRNRDLPDTAMAILIQKQIRGVFSGVAFSRDPISQQGDAVVIEALPGDAPQIVSGRVTPQQYQIQLPAVTVTPEPSPLAGTNHPPADLLQRVASLARELETRYQGIPQDIEWSFDGQEVWILQARPITTLQPIWTRKIAAEVIPGLIRPLTWSINRPLTCGVWGELFTLVLGQRAKGLDFKETATLHYGRAYFNATLLGDLFLRMGLPPESLDFLTRGSKFSRPPIRSTLRNLPGLGRLLGREWRLDQDFEVDSRDQVAPLLRQIQTQPTSDLPAEALLARIEQILGVLKRMTYYSILAPLSLSLRQAVFQVKDQELDPSQTPEVASLRALTQLANDARHLLRLDAATCENPAAVFGRLAETPDGQTILAQLEEFFHHYGYLSDVATDIAVPTWQEDPRPVRQMFAQFLCHPPPTPKRPKRQRPLAQLVQARLDLKGRVTEVYSRLLAHLRWSFLALADHGLQSGWLSELEDIFFLEFAEIQSLVAANDPIVSPQLKAEIQKRRSQLDYYQQLTLIPALVYGYPPVESFLVSPSSPSSGQRWQGIGASSGIVEGRVRVCKHLQAVAEIDRETILVVPYTDSGWAPLLARAGGLIAEVGGRLSHGAIVAREYGIPAVMDIHNATQLLHNGQRVRINGQLGIVEVLG